MQEFSYIALNEQGKRIKGKIESKDRESVHKLLKKKWLLPNGSYAYWGSTKRCFLWVWYKS